MAAVSTCHWHPERETRLTCSQCGRWMCVQCMRQHPVGIRCKECSAYARLPMFELSGDTLVRGLGAMLGLGVAGGLALVILGQTPVFGFFSLMLMLGLGYVTGEGISAAVNRKRGRPFQWMAAGGVLIALGVSWGSDLLIHGTLFVGFFTLIGALIAVVAATSRLRP